MRFLMKIVVPTAAENAAANDPGFEETLQNLFRRLGAQANYSRIESGRRVDYVLVELQAGEITAAAEAVFRLLKVKSEFLPEVAPKSYYGRTGY